jgi:hypothetical protein
MLRPAASRDFEPAGGAKLSGANVGVFLLAICHK